MAGDRARARTALGALGLVGMESRRPRASRAASANGSPSPMSVLVVEPDLLVLDEPTRGVDPQRKVELAELLRAGAERRATLLVTHDEDLARTPSNPCCLWHDNHLAQQQPNRTTPPQREGG